MILLWRWVGGYYVAFGVPFLSGAVLYLWHDRIPLDWRLAAIGAAILLICLHTTGFRLAFATLGAYLVIFLAVAPSVRLPDLLGEVISRMEFTFLLTPSSRRSLTYSGQR